MPPTIEEVAPQRHAGKRAEKTSRPITFEHLVEMADNAGVKLEMTGGIPTWETFPGPRHQKAVGRIFATVERSSEDRCACFQLLDTYIRFPDGSLKRPDIAVFCEEPPDIDEAYPKIPEAVLEVLSKDYEKKDTHISAPFYLEQGVKDVILFDPRTGDITHRRRDGDKLLRSPVTIQLECGCRITV
jgi:Uma2 family endonuclease